MATHVQSIVLILKRTTRKTFTPKFLINESAFTCVHPLCASIEKVTWGCHMSQNKGYAQVGGGSRGYPQLEDTTEHCPTQPHGGAGLAAWFSAIAVALWTPLPESSARGGGAFCCPPANQPRVRDAFPILYDCLLFSAEPNTPEVFIISDFYL